MNQHQFDQDIKMRLEMKLNLNLKLNALLASSSIRLRVVNSELITKSPAALSLVCRDVREKRVLHFSRSFFSCRYLSSLETHSGSVWIGCDTDHIACEQQEQPIRRVPIMRGNNLQHVFGPEEHPHYIHHFNYVSLRLNVCCLWRLLSQTGIHAGLSP